jgi:hypothetical protein
VADLASLNERLSRYLLRYLTADALQADPISVTEERALAESMIALASQVLGRANHRTPSDRPDELEGDATLKRLTNGRPAER